MTLKIDEVRHISKLSKLEIKESNLTQYQDDLNNLLTLVEEMQNCDTTNIAPMAHPLDMTQRLRADNITEQPDRDKLMNQSPESEDGFFIVPPVIE